MCAARSCILRAAQLEQTTRLLDAKGSTCSEWHDSQRSRMNPNSGHLRNRSNSFRTKVVAVGRSEALLERRPVPLKQLKDDALVRCAGAVDRLSSRAPSNATASRAPATPTDLDLLSPGRDRSASLVKEGRGLVRDRSTGCTTFDDGTVIEYGCRLDGLPVERELTCGTSAPATCASSHQVFVYGSWRSCSTRISTRPTTWESVTGGVQPNRWVTC